MIILVVIALAMTAITIVIHGLGTSWWLHHMARRYPGARRMSVRKRFFLIVQTALLMIVLHFIEIVLWAAMYMTVVAEKLGSFEAAVYFSAVTFTTVGYGDITLDSSWRLLSGFEAIGGIVLIGWTTAFLYAVLQHMWGAHETSNGDTNEQPGN